MSRTSPIKEKEIQIPNSLQELFNKNTILPNELYSRFLEQLDDDIKKLEEDNAKFKYYNSQNVSQFNELSAEEQQAWFEKASTGFGRRKTSRRRKSKLR